MAWMKSWAWDQHEARSEDRDSPCEPGPPERQRERRRADSNHRNDAKRTNQQNQVWQMQRKEKISLFWPVFVEHE